MDRSLQSRVWQRADDRCEYCRISQASDRLPFEIDHVIAETHEGLTKASNLCLSFFAFHPRRHKWSRHFRWDGPVLIGLTPGGRATVQVLKINLDHRVGFRRALIEEGVFPPG